MAGVCVLGDRRVKGVMFSPAAALQGLQAALAWCNKPAQLSECPCSD